MGSLYVGASGLKSSQNALNTTANNLANVDTTGYVRQQVLFGDTSYTTFSTSSSISNQQCGLGVEIADIIHARDIFLDKSYRTESGRQAFYETCYSAVDEVQTYYQEMEGEAFQTNLGDFWTAFQEFEKDPSNSTNQNLVIQKASLFLSRSQSVNSSLQGYQDNMNTQISDDIDQINDLGQTIYDLNTQITKVEAGGVETAMSLRDQRDSALDELSALASISYKELPDGSVKVKLEGVDFVDESHVYEMGKEVDETTGFITPYWPQMSDTTKEQYSEVFNYNVDISSEYNTDLGELKALVMQRGDHRANYSDIEGMSADEYNDSTGMSAMLTSESQLDQLIHNIVTAINDTICPNVETTSAITGTDEDGNTVTIPAGTLVLDTDHCAVGSDGTVPPQELFVRIGCERYATVTATDASGNETKYYVYNEEDTSDTSKMYTTGSLSVNSVIAKNTSLLAHLTQSGDVAQDLGKALAAVWSDSSIVLSPNNTGSCTFAEYYTQMIGELGTTGSVYDTKATTLEGTVSAVDNQRQQVIGVSSDEELTNMIKFQNAYNAASRYINVVSEMLETLVTSLGA